MNKLMFSPSKNHSHWRLAYIALALAAASHTLAQVVVLSDFDDGSPDWDGEADILNGVTFSETGGQLVINGQFPETNPSCHPRTSTAIWWNEYPSVRDASTLELRADLVRANQNDVFAQIMYDQGGVGGYCLMKDEDEIILMKYRPMECTVAAVLYENTPIKNENVTLVLALTGAGENVFITARVLDNELHPSPILFEGTFIDTPEIDPTENDVHGLAWGPDPGAPFTTSDGPIVGMQHYTDGTQGPAEVLLDNFVYEYRPATDVNIERAVRLSWPDFATSFVVEGAPTVDGPWVPVDEPVLKNNGLNWMTVPAPLSSTLKVFRLQEAAP